MATALVTGASDGIGYEPSALVLAPDFVARSAVAGCLKGKSLVIPGWSNHVAMLLLQLVPKSWLTRVFGFLYRRVLGGADQTSG